MVEHMECPRAFLGKLVLEHFFFSPPLRTALLLSYRRGTRSHHSDLSHEGASVRGRYPAFGQVLPNMITLPVPPPPFPLSTYNSTRES